MRILTHIITAGLLLAYTLNVAYAEDDEHERSKKSTRSTKTTTSSTSTSTTTTTTGAAAAFLSPAGEGRRAWLKYNCYSCHGMRAAGGMGPNIAHEGDDVGEAVRQGEEGGMPSYGSMLTSTEISNLQTYLRSIGTASEPKFNDWWLPIPPK